MSVLSSADTDDGTDKYEIPDSSRGFVNIAMMSPLDLLKVKANHNGITTDPDFVDKDDDGFDDRDEYEGGHKISKDFRDSVVGFIAGVINNLIFGSSLDREMNDRSTDNLLGRAFNHKGLITTWEQRRAFEASGRQLEQAIIRARQTPDTDSFLNLCDARMQRKIAAVDMIMNDARARGDEQTYEKAHAMEEKFKNIRHDVGVLQQKLAGETDESKKQAEIKALMPTMWDRYQKGELTTDDGGLFNAWRPSDAPGGGGITDAFWGTLSGMFKLAGFHLPTMRPSAPATDGPPALQM